MLSKVIGSDQWKGCYPRLDVMNGMVQERCRRKTGMVLWKPPDLHWIKLNVGGAFSSSSQNAGGGGVVRDSEGEILLAFSSGLKSGSGLEAEVDTVLLGVRLAKRLGSQVWIESDAEVVVRWLAAEQLGAAETCVEMEKVRKELEGITWKVSHIFREGNKVADYLAEIGLQSVSMTTFSRDSAPARVKALCRMDQLGLPNFRF